MMEDRCQRSEIRDQRSEGNAQKSGKAVLEAENLGRDFRMGPVLLTVLRDVALQIFTGETVAIMGASGAGKSTLLHVIGGLDRPTRGRVLFRESDVYAISARQRTVLRARHIGFVFQFYHLLPELDVLENVMLPAMNSSLGILSFAYPVDRTFKKGGRGVPARLGGAFGEAWAEPSESVAHSAAADSPYQPENKLFLQYSIRDRALHLLEAVGLAERGGHLPAELSGGEQQRAAVARALVNDPELILADEPTGNLDSTTGAQVLNVLFTLVREKQRTLVMVTHNAEVAARCDRVLKLQDGRLLPA